MPELLEAPDYIVVDRSTGTIHDPSNLVAIRWLRTVEEALAAGLTGEDALSYAEYHGKALYVEEEN